MILCRIYTHNEYDIPLVEREQNQSNIIILCSENDKKLLSYFYYYTRGDRLVSPNDFFIYF